MRKQRPRYPKVKDITLVLRQLEVVPKDFAFSTGWRESEKGTPNYRIATQTNQIPWSVDIYAGQYFIVRVGSRLTEECNNVPQIVLYLHRMLGVKRVSG